MSYGSELAFGLCFVDNYPGIRRACLLDLTGGVMGIIMGILLMMIEFISAYLNENDVSYSVDCIKSVILLLL